MVYSLRELAKGGYMSEGEPYRSSDVGGPNEGFYPSVLETEIALSPERLELEQARMAFIELAQDPQMEREAYLAALSRFHDALEALADVNEKTEPVEDEPE